MHANEARPPSVAAAASSSVIANNAAGAARAAVRRPGWLVLVPTFVMTHFTLAWALVPPIYLVLQQTNLSNALLAGPQGAWFLSRKVPSWVPDTLVDGIVGGPSTEDDASAARHGKQQQHQQMTIEQLIERLARRGIHIGWKYGGAAVKSLRSMQGDEEKMVKEATRKMIGTKKGSGEQSEVETKARSVKESVLGYTRKHAQHAADGIAFSQVRDGIAAWVLVKLLLPIRVPASLFLTPKVARLLLRVYSR